MLLIDGVKYELWTPPNEDEFEKVVKEHTKEIFGEQSIYLDLKQKLKSGSGIGSIPDGYAIVLGDLPEWHIVEIELSTHPLDQHIVSQVSRFIAGINNPSIQRGIVSSIYSEITSDDFLRIKVEKAIKPKEIYYFLDDLISKPPILTIIIEKYTEGLREALATLAHPQKEVVEFQTFTRKDAEKVHAHLFEPVCQTPSKGATRGGISEGGTTAIQRADEKHIDEDKGKNHGERVIAGKVTFEELIIEGLLKDEQVLYFYNTRPFTDERAKVMASSNRLKYESDGQTYSKSELAKILLIKHGFKHDEYGVAGPKYWKTEDGKFLLELEEKIRVLRGDRGKTQ